MSARICPSCRHELPSSSAFCPTCGTRTLEATAPNEALPAATAPNGDDPAYRARLQRALGDGWQLSRLIGRGGFADVYAVWDLQLRRQVAVKTLRSDLPVSAAMLQRFRREAEAIARLRHPHIVPVYSVGQGEDLAYFMMPLLEGESLAAPLARGETFTIAETSRILREAAGALGAAHRTGVIHRDVKPDNIMLEGPDRRAVVMDFGISKLADSAEAGLTGTGFLVGSPHFMAPEQAAGERDIDHRADQYALAVVGFQMLIGRPPFQADSVQAMLMKQVTETPPRVGDLRPDVPEGIAAAIDRALSKDPARRFGSMEEFAAALGPAAAGPMLGSGARRRLEPRARAALARDSVARWRLPAIALGVVAFVVFLITYGLTRPSPAAFIAAQRTEASFAGRVFLSALGVPSDAATVTTWQEDDSVYRFVQRVTPTKRAADSIAAATGVWRWAVKQRDAGRRETWTAYVAENGRILGYDVTVSDSAAGATLDNDAARAIAERVLVERGFTTDALRFAGDSVVPRRGRSDHVLTWIDPRGSLGGAADTAARGVVVRVLGDRVGGYRERFVLPASALKSPWPGSFGLLAGAIGSLGCIVLIVLAFVLAIRRSRLDELQWTTFVRFSAVTVVALAAMVTVEIYQDTLVSGDRQAQAVFGQGLSLFFVVGLAMVMIVFIGVAGESIASEARPAAVAGVFDVAGGRFIIPEMATASLVGYAAGLGLLALADGGAAIAQRLLGLPLDTRLPDAATMPLPSSVAIVELATAIPLVIGILYCVALSAWRRRLAPLLLVLPTLIFATLTIGMDSEEVALHEVAIRAALTFAMTLIVWRFGLLSGVLAFFVLLTAPNVVALLAAGSAGHIVAGLVTLLLLLAPAAAGFLAYRRIPRTLAAYPTTPSPR